MEHAGDRPRAAERSDAAESGRGRPHDADFLRNRWFTPSLQTALVTALAKFGPIEGMEPLIQVASRMQGETRARFLIESVRMLAQHHEKDGRIAKLRMSHLVPVAVATDGTLVAAAAVDYVYWDKNTAEFAQRPEFKESAESCWCGAPRAPRRRRRSPRAGITMRTGMRP